MVLGRILLLENIMNVCHLFRTFILAWSPAVPGTQCSLRLKRVEETHREGKMDKSHRVRTKECGKV